MPSNRWHIKSWGRCVYKTGAGKGKGQRFSGKPIIKLNSEGSLKFNRATVQLCNDIYSINQEYHIRHLTEVVDSTPIVKFAFISQRALSAYIASLSRPDMTCGFAILAQYHNPTIEKVRVLKNIIRQAKSSTEKFNFSKTGYLNSKTCCIFGR